MTASGGASKEWQGRFYEDMDVGDVFRSRLGRTISEADNTWFTALTMNTNQVHFNRPFAEQTRFGQPLVVSTLTLAVVVGLSVADTSENAVANLSWTDIQLPNPVYAGDTLWAESEVLALRESKTQRGIGIVSIRTRGLNQRSDVIIEFQRTFMLAKRSAAVSVFPATAEPWRVS